MGGIDSFESTTCLYLKCSWNYRPCTLSHPTPFHQSTKSYLWQLPLKSGAQESEAKFTQQTNKAVFGKWAESKMST